VCNIENNGSSNVHYMITMMINVIVECDVTLTILLESMYLETVRDL